MDTVLVISNEPALAETLASELAECAVTHAYPKEVASKVKEGQFRLILADDDGSADAVPATDIPVEKLTRPVRLQGLLYTIRKRLQSKTAPVREDMELAPGYVLSVARRVLYSRSHDIRVGLTEKETELLLCLAEEKGRLIARDVLLKRVWGYSDDIATRTLETHIYRLRGKLRQANEGFDIAFSEEGGYRLVAA